MKKILLYFFIILLVLSGVCGCDRSTPSSGVATTAITTMDGTKRSEPDNRPTSVYYTTNYEMKEMGGKYYIIPETPEYYEKRGTQIAGVDFNSFDEFYNKVTSKQLTESNLVRVVHTFSKDDLGIVVCDFNDLSTPIYPENITTNRVWWYGDNYFVNFAIDNHSYGRAGFYPLEEFRRQMQNEPWQGALYHEELVEERNAEVFYYKNLSICVQYELKESGKTLLVREFYNANSFENGYVLDESAELFCVEMYCTEDDRPCVFSFYNLEERPTVEWLKSFGVTKYNPVLKTDG